MKIESRNALYWHSFFLAVTSSFTEINTVMPALILEAGGGVGAVGVLTGIMVGLPLISQLLFAGLLHERPRKKPFLLFGINMRVFALALAGVGIAVIGTNVAIIPIVFVTMSLFALSGAFAGVSYTELVGKLVDTSKRRVFFVRRQLVTATGLLVSAGATRLLLGQTEFPDGYVVLFALAAGFLLLASMGFWVLREPETSAPGDRRPGVGIGRALRDVPGILKNDERMRALIAVANLGAPAFTALPLLTALAHRSYDLEPASVGTFVLVQIVGMLVSNYPWSRLIARGGFRLLLRAELIVLVVLLALSPIVATVAPVWVYAGLYFLAGAAISAHRLGMEAVLVQISPDEKRSLYAGVFGATNLGTAIMPFLTGVLVSAVGFAPVFVGAGALAIVGQIPIRKINCGEWYRDDAAAT